jgi:hypothetical protein
MVVILLARSNQNYPHIAPMSVSWRFLVSWSLGFQIPYPKYHFGSPALFFFIIYLLFVLFFFNFLKFTQSSKIIYSCEPICLTRDLCHFIIISFKLCQYISFLGTSPISYYPYFKEILAIKPCYQSWKCWSLLIQISA